MIRANELRIGNKIIRKPKHDKHHEISVTPFTFSEMEAITGVVYQGIPLTEEWWNKMDVEWRSSYCIIVNGWLQLEKKPDIDEWSIFIDDKEIIFKYVHELQNFISSTGEELKIKQ